MEKAKRILSLAGPHWKCIDLSGKTSIPQLAAVSERSALFFGVDSAPMHIAAAAGTPVVALFGPSGAFNWGPWIIKVPCPAFNVRRSKVLTAKEAGYRPLAFTP